MDIDKNDINRPILSVDKIEAPIKVQRSRTMIQDYPRLSQIGCQTCNHKLNRNFQNAYNKSFQENSPSLSIKSTKLIGNKVEENLPSSFASIQPIEECSQLGRTKYLIMWFDKKTNRSSNDRLTRKLDSRTKVFDGENSTDVKMSGKGRVKDLVNKLNGNANYEINKIQGIESKLFSSFKSTNDNSNGREFDDTGADSFQPKMDEIVESEISNENDEENEKKPEERNFDENSDTNWSKNPLEKQFITNEEQSKPQDSECDRLSTEKSLEEMQRLRDCENRLLAEIQELREQNELLEFRLLELEYYNINNSSKTERTAMEEITERDENSDSGVMSLSPCEDFYSETDLLDIKLDEEESRLSGNEVQQKLSRLFHGMDNTCDKVVLQQAIDLIKHYEMRIIGMETTLTNMCQERIQQHSEEFLTSLKNSEEYLKLKNRRVIATVSPFTTHSKVETRLSESFSEKLFPDADRLHESGIFDEFTEHELVERKSTETQTESANLIIARGMNLINGLSNNINCRDKARSGLADELNKLEKIKQRIEERSPLFNSLAETSNTKDCVKKVPIVMLSKELAYFKKQYDVLKNRLAAFESSGDSKIKQLAEKLQKENELQKRVEFLTKKMSKMEKEMRRLEEEKCEYEEAENDTRLRCQKLEVKLYALAEKKNDLQFQLQQHIRTVSTLRNTVCELEKKKDEAFQKTYKMEMIVNEYEERNFELEEREMDVRYSFQILQSAFPVIIFWNFYIMLKWYMQGVQRLMPNVAALPTSTEPSVPTHFACDCAKFREQTIELKNRISTLERDLREKDTPIGSDLKAHNESYKSKPYSPEFGNDRRSSLQEEVYVQTLQQADEIITSIENDFKQKLDEMQQTLTDKQWKLEECERKLAVVSSSRAMENHLMEKMHNLETDISTLKQMLRTRDEEKQVLLQKQKSLLEEVDTLNAYIVRMKEDEEEIRRKLEEERTLAKEQRAELEFKEQEMSEFEQSTDNHIKQLERRIIHLTRETENQEVTNGELKEEVETLENAICDLNLRLNHEKDEKERMLVKFRQELAFKQQELDSLRRLSQDMTAISTAQEISLLQNNKLNPPPPYNDRYSHTLPKIISAIEQKELKNGITNNANRVRLSIERLNSKSESSTHVIRHKDRYTILLRPLATENFSNFEVIVNNHRIPTVYQCKQRVMENGVQGDTTISVTIKSVI